MQINRAIDPVFLFGTIVECLAKVIKELRIISSKYRYKILKINTKNQNYETYCYLINHFVTNELQHLKQ
jgi:hypothetical protein